MSGKAGMTTKKRKTLPARARPGWLRRGDGRTGLYRALHSRLAAFAEQYGGADALTPMESTLLERLVHIEAVAQKFEEQLRSGKTADVGGYLASVDRLHSIGRTMGLSRRAKPALDLHAYMANKSSPRPADKSSAVDSGSVAPHTPASPAGDGVTVR